MGGAGCPEQRSLPSQVSPPTARSRWSCAPRVSPLPCRCKPMASTSGCGPSSLPVVGGRRPPLPYLRNLFALKAFECGSPPQKTLRLRRTQPTIIGLSSGADRSVRGVPAWVLVYKGGHLFRARERKDNLVGTIAEPRKGLVWLAILRTL